jgi:hypothetical protein
MMITLQKATDFPLHMIHCTEEVAGSSPDRPILYFP